MPEPRLLFRFNSCIRIFASILFSVQMLLYMAIVVYAPSIALIQVLVTSRHSTLNLLKYRNEL